MVDVARSVSLPNLKVFLGRDKGLLKSTLKSQILSIQNFFCSQFEASHKHLKDIGIAQDLRFKAGYKYKESPLLCTTMYEARVRRKSVIIASKVANQLI